MRDPIQLNAGWWWRFSKYELRDDILRPAEGAELVWYDPWEEYHRYSGQKRLCEAQPPYFSAVTLGKKLPTLAWSSEGRDQILDWCSRYGLLGLLLFRVRQVTLEPRWEPLLMRDPARPNGPPIVKPRGGLVPVNRQFIRNSGIWSVPQQQHMVPTVRRRGRVRSGQVIPAGDRVPSWPQPGVLIREINKDGWSVEKLGVNWGRFFPTVPDRQKDTFSYPVPGSDEFCRMYAEPLNDFMDGVALLARAVEGIARFKQIGKPGIDDWLIRRGWPDLRALYDAGGMLLVPNPDQSLTFRWVASCLLSSFAMMAAQDVAEQRLKRCIECNKLFLADPRAFYCSSKCKLRANKRTTRRQRRKDSFNGGAR